ncbi:cationic amino acid transporter 2-like [Uloborus diversus]|uniref:cationic amino acid transporter 2-like n=1 Tax=Uloborus diversus TaxID=327109 RepID=UPI0024093C01|nr:cationic amino acid transporter 2-like [Uloborus diversus]
MLESLFANNADNVSYVFPQVNQNAVPNLSSKYLTPNQLNALKLNSNFASCSKPSFPKLVAPVEKAFRFSALTASQKDSIRHIIANTVDFNSKLTSNTFCKHANSSIKGLCSDPDLVVTKADKGGQIVILDKSSYLGKCNELIEVGPYVTLHKDPSIREFNLIKNVVNSSPIISESSKRYLTPSVAHCARFYALPKVHKPDIPLRPIVSNIGLATTLGTGLYALISMAAHEHAGPSVVLSILMAAVTACLGGLCYSEVVTRFPKGGSAYSYAYATTGELSAFLIGWGMVLEYATGAALAAKACSQYMDVVLGGVMSRVLGQYLGHMNIAGLDKNLDFPALVVTLFVCLLLAWSAKVLCSLNNLLVIVNLLVISGVVLVGIFSMDSENWIAGTGFFPGGISGIFSAASLCYFAFVGYDIIAIFTRDSPHRGSTFPTVVSLIFLVGLLATFAMSVVLTLLVPYSLLEIRGPILQAFDIRSVTGMKYFATVGAVSGLVSAAAASVFSLVKLLQSLTNDGLLFKFLSRTQCHTLLSTGIMCCSLSFFCDVKILAHVLGIGTLFACISVAVSVLCLRYGVSVQLRTPTDLLELSEEDSTIETTKVPEQQTNRETQTEKDNVKESVRGKMDYGSLHPRSLSVDFVDESYVTCLSEMSPHWTKEEPTHRSAATAAGLIAAAMLVMLLMGVVTLHIPRLLPRSRWWTELVACVLFVTIIGFSAAICRQPKHKPRIRNKVPCVPFLPLCAIWMDVHLLLAFSSTAWIVFFVWSLIGTLLYLCFGIWNSSERRSQDTQNVNLLSVAEDVNDSDKENIQDSFQDDF